MELMRHEDIQESLGAYVLHALPDDEAALVAAHLPGCATCQAEVDSLFETVAELGALDQAPVNSAMWDRISVAIAAPAEHASPTAQVAQAARSVENDATSVAQRAPVVDHVAPIIALDAAREARRDRQRTWKIGVAAAAAAAAIVAPIALSFGSGGTSLAAIAKKAANQSGSTTTVLLDNNGKKIAKVIVTKSGKGYLVDDTLPALPAGQTYQLWAVTDSAAISAGLLGADPEVSAFNVAAPTKAFALTVEPEAGSVVATTKPMAVGELS